MTPSLDALRRAAPVLLVLGVLLAGCDRDPAPAAVASASASSSAREVVPSGPLADLEAPAEVLAFGGATSVAVLTQRIQALAGPLAPMTASKEVVAVELQKKLGLRATTGFDMERPIRFAMLESSDSPDPFVMLVGTAGRDTLRLTLPEGAIEGDGNNDLSYPIGPGGPDTPPPRRYVNFIADTAVFTTSPAVFAAHQAFFARLCGATGEADAEVVVSVGNAVARHGADIERDLGRLKAQLGEGGATTPGLTDALDWAVGAVKDLDRLHLSLRLAVSSSSGDGARLAIALRPREGAALAATFGELRGRPIKLFDRLPADAPFAAGFVVDPSTDVAKRFKRLSMRLVSGVDELPEAHRLSLDRY